jgi:hypothetical protein
MAVVVFMVRVAVCGLRVGWLGLGGDEAAAGTDFGAATDGPATVGTGIEVVTFDGGGEFGFSVHGVGHWLELAPQ